MKTTKLSSCMIAACIAGLLTSSCATVYTEFQSAKTVGQGNSELTPTVSGVWMSSEGETDYAQTNIGAQFAYGLSDHVDFRLRLETIALGSEFEGLPDYNVFGAGPKFSLVQERLAAYLPVGFGFGSGIETRRSFETHPTLLFTQMLSDQMEFNLSGKWIVPLYEDADNLVAFNLGFGGIGKSVILRPAAGLLFNPGESGVFYDFGLGVTIPFNKK